MILLTTPHLPDAPNPNQACPGALQISRNKIKSSQHRLVSSSEVENAGRVTLLIPLYTFQGNQCFVIHSETPVTQKVVFGAPSPFAGLYGAPRPCMHARGRVGAAGEHRLHLSIKRCSASPGTALLNCPGKCRPLQFLPRTCREPSLILHRAGLSKQSSQTR